MLTGKVWGKTELVLQTPLLEIHRLTIEPKMRCSIHKHETKWNAFVVLEGQLTIEIEKQEYALVDKTVLGPGDLTAVPPGLFHCFISGDREVKALEIYYLEPLSEDIIRRDCGGPVHVSIAHHPV